MQRSVYPVSGGYQETRSEEMNEPELGSILSYYINLDERGHDFYADVRNAYGKSVFEITGLGIFEDGFMTSKSDLVGLKSYLVCLGVMAPHQQLLEA